MSRHARLASSALVVLVSLFGANRALAGDPAKFVSPDTIAYVQGASFDQVNAKLREVIGAVDPTTASKFDLRTSLLADFGGEVEPALIDSTRPFAITLTIPQKNPQPIVTFIVPTQSREKLVAAIANSHKHFAAESDGDYVAWSSAKPATPMLAAEAGALAQKLPSGVLAARVDLAKVITIYRGLIDMGLDRAEESIGQLASLSQQPGIDTEAMFSAYLDGARSFVDCAEQLELGFDVVDSRADLSSRLTVKKDSAMDGWSDSAPTGVENLAYLVDSKAAMSMLIGANYSKLFVRAKPAITAMFDAYKEPLHSVFANFLKDADSVLPLIGKAQVAYGDFTPDGMRFTYFIVSPDPTALLQRYERFLTAPELAQGGMTIDSPKEVEVAGTKTKQYRMKMSPEALGALKGGAGAGLEPAAVQKMLEGIYGKDGLRFALAPKSGMLAVVVGGDDSYLAGALAKLAGAPSKSATVFAPALARVAGQSPFFVVRMDIGSVLAFGMQMSSAFGLDNGRLAAKLPSCTIELRGGIAERTWSAAVSIDPRELGQFTKAMGASQEAATRVVRAKVDIHSIDAAIQQFQLNNDGKLPESLEILIKPDANGAAYLEGGALPKDPWGHAYVYTTDGKTYRVASYGSDGKPGGEGDAADLDQNSK